MLTKAEEQVIRNIITRLRCTPHETGQPREADKVREALRGDARVYLETWVIGSLQCLLPETRDIPLAVSLSR